MNNLIQNIREYNPKWVLHDFEEVLKDVSGGNMKVKKEDYLETGKIPVVDQGQTFIGGFSDNDNAKCKAKTPVIIFGDHTRILKFIDFEFAMGADGVKVLRPQKGNNAKYLYYFLTSLRVPETGYNRHFKYLKAAKIPLPPLPLQHQIADLLDTADALRQSTRQQLDALDELAQAVFLEMFGELVHNSKKWQVVKFAEVTSSRLGKMLDQKKQTGAQKKPYLRNANVQWNRFDLTDLSEMDFDDKELQEFLLKKGDILMCEGGEVGRCAIWNNQIKECYYQKALHCIRPNTNHILAEYLVYLMWHFSKHGGFDDFVSTATIAHLTGVKLKSMKIPLPPIELQTHFATLIENIEAQKTQLKETLRASEEMFGGLLQEVFG